MDTKLTLKLDQTVIEQAKNYASDHKQSLSRIIENYLKILVGKKEKQEIEISPFVRSMALKSNIAADLNVKEEYRKHLEKKHK